MIAYKFLRADGSTAFSGFRWPLPDGAPGAWVQAPVVPCRSGVHACRPVDLPFWVGDVLYEVELDGELLAEETKVVAPRGRLRQRIGAWEDGARDDYTRWCADRAHELARTDSPRLDPWDAGVEPSVPEGPAVLGFIASAIAEELGGLEAYRAERARQAEWLTTRLGL
jgi:hypothetical protein